MVSFKNESVKERIERKRKSKSSAFGVIVALIALVVVAGVFGAMKFWESQINDEIAIYDEQIKNTNTEIKSMSKGKEADFFKRMEVMKRDIYKRHSSVDVLSEIENVMVPRVVLVSFSHTVDSLGQGEEVVITADADEFYLMAQQIEQFKKSEYFGNVRASDTSKDNVGRIVFTITADVVDTDSLLYSEDNNKRNVQPTVQPQPTTATQPITQPETEIETESQLETQPTGGAEEAEAPQESPTETETTGETPQEGE